MLAGGMLSPEPRRNCASFAWIQIGTAYFFFRMLFPLIWSVCP
jgi:hypothetical protein